jgi:hypothetical protein
MLRALLTRLTHRFSPKPTRQPRNRATIRRCDACGRPVAHTLAGKPYLHRCRVELLPGGKTEA